MDGKRVRFSGNFIDSFFSIDQYGSFIPSPDKLLMGAAEDLFNGQLRSKEMLNRMAERYYNTDVRFTNNPRGNSPVIGFGFKRFGNRPLAERSKILW